MRMTMRTLASWVAILAVLALATGTTAFPIPNFIRVRWIPRAQISQSDATPCSVFELRSEASPSRDPAWPEGGAVSEEFVLHLLNRLRTGHMISLELIQNIVDSTAQLLQNDPNVLDIQVGQDEILTVCGDIHGQFYDLLHIWQMNGYPSPQRRYIFNGDFVDRGAYSLECILSLFAWKLCYPQAIFLIRGNHESIYTNETFGFRSEIQTKCPLYSAKVFDLFSEAFCKLPIAAILTGDSSKPKVFVVHGGLPGGNVTIDALQRKIRRFQQPFSAIGVPVKYLLDLLWADPGSRRGLRPSDRGPSIHKFGSDITDAFLVKNNVKLVVRSHETMSGGYGVTHRGRVLTVFSAPHYGRGANLGALLRFDYNLDVEAVRFPVATPTFKKSARFTKQLHCTPSPSTTLH